MKKIYTFITIALMLLGFSTSSVAETYNAWGAILFAYISTPMYDANETIEVTAESIKFHSDTWGDGEFAASTGDGTLTMTNHGVTNDYAADISGTVQEGQFVINVPSVMGGTTITVTLGEMPVLANVAGSYDAWGGILFAYISSPMWDKDEKIEIGAERITFSSGTWGNGDFAATAIANDDGSYSITGEGTLTMANHGVSNDYAADITGTIADDSRVIVINVPSVMGGTTITVTLGDMPAAIAADGTYTGGTYANAAYFSKYQPARDQTVTISANDDHQTVSVSHTSETWGTFTYDNVTVTVNDDGTYTLSGDGNCAMPSMTTGDINNYPSDFSGTIAEGVLVAEFTVPGVMGGTTLLFNPSDFDDVWTASIKDVESSTGDTATYNLRGERVDSNYRGIVIRQGKKCMQR